MNYLVSKVLFRVIVAGLALVPILGAAQAEEAAAQTEYQEMVSVADFTYLCESEVKALAGSIAKGFNFQKNEVAAIGKSIIINTGYWELNDKIKMLAERKDIPPRHIIFEASFVTVHPYELKKLGARITADYDDRDAEKYGALGDVESRKEHVFDVDTDYGLAGNFTHSVLWTFTQGANLFKLTTGYVLNEGIGKIISKPVVRVKEGESGMFKSVVNVPYETVSDYGTNIQYEEAGITIDILEAHISPSPTPDLDKKDPNYIPDLIWADIEVSDGKVEQIYGLVSTNVTKIASRGYYQNGETFIAASLVKEEDTFSISKVPVFWKLPLLGKLFRSKDIVHDRTETIVLIRPTVEDRYSQEFMASRFKDAQDLLSIKLGGREHDSMRIHPLADAPWKGVPEIYENKGCPEFTYWGMLDTYIDAEITDLGERFKTVRNRIGMILGQNWDQLKKQVDSDKGLEAAIGEVLDKFAEDTGKRKPTVRELLIAAAHSGNINEKAFHMYLDRLGLPRKCAAEKAEEKGN